MKTTSSLSLSISSVKWHDMTCFLVTRLTSSIDSANLNQNELTVILSLRIDKLLLHWQFNVNVVSVADYNRYEAMTLSCCCGIAIHLSWIGLLVLQPCGCGISKRRVARFSWAHNLRNRFRTWCIGLVAGSSVSCILEHS